MECHHTKSVLYAFARLIIGVFFAYHGIQKLMGFTSFGFMQAVGIAEVLVGALVLVGLFTSYASLLGAGIMVGAYVFHSFGFFATNAVINLDPFTNKSELALIFLASFIMMGLKGGGCLSLDALFAKKESDSCCATQSECCGHCHSHDHSHDHHHDDVEYVTADDDSQEKPAKSVKSSKKAHK
jgi:putative oxidoreductase